MLRRSMHRGVRYLLLAAVALVLLQAARPPRNLGQRDGPEALGRHQKLPPPVADILGRACYDCHSDRTHYPWYANVQPMGWLIEKHVIDGKARLNFSRFGRIDARGRAHHFDEIVQEVERHEMPLASYTWLHPEAKLTPAEKRALIDWAVESRRAVLAAGEGG